MLVFSTQLCELLPIQPSLWFNSAPPPPSLCEKMLYTPMQCLRGWGVWDCGPQTDKDLPQSPFIGQFLRWRHFALSSMSHIFLRYIAPPPPSHEFRGWHLWGSRSIPFLRLRWEEGWIYCRKGRSKDGLAHPYSYPSVRRVTLLCRRRCGIIFFFYYYYNFWTFCLLSISIKLNSYKKPINNFFLTPPPPPYSSVGVGGGGGGEVDK